MSLQGELYSLSFGFIYFYDIWIALGCDLILGLEQSLYWHWGSFPERSTFKETYIEIQGKVWSKLVGFPKQQSPVTKH